MKKLLESLKTQVKGPLQTAKITWNQSDVSLENDIEDLREILECIKNKKIIIQSNNGYNDKTAGNQVPTCEDTKKDVPKKRGRKTKMSTASTVSKGRSNSSDSMSLNDSTASTSSTRSRRAAAQAADHKLAQVSLVQLKTKLRRPTNFNEKQSKAVSSPPAKCRRTHRNQSAGSSSPQHGDEVNGDIDGVKVDNMMEVDNEKLNKECLVPVEKLNTPTIKSYTRPNTRSSRSLDRASDRNSKDLFNDSAPLSELNNKCASQEAPNSDPTHKNNRKKSMSKKDLDSGISSTEEELQQLMKAKLPIAPFSLEPFDDEFRGFDDQPQNIKAERPAGLVRDNTFVVDIKTDETHESSCEEPENNCIKSRTKVLRKRMTHTVINVEEKENVNRNNETHIVTSTPDHSPNLSQTKVLKKTVDHSVKSNKNNEKNSDEDLESLSSPETRIRSRTKTLRKHNEQHQELKSDNEVAGRSVRSRTKTIKKHNEKEDQSDTTDDESSNIRSRTKTIKKGTTNVANNGLDSEYLISEFKDNPLSSKMNTRLPPSSPAPAKGELVKKRVEDFEKMQNGMEEVEEEKTVTRVTRNAIKNKVTSSAVETQSSKHARAMMQLPASFKKTNRKSVDKGKRDKVKEEKENIPVAKAQASAIKPPSSVERPRMTPLGVNNRMISAPDSALKAQAKWTNSANRPAPVETNNVAFIHKQAAEEGDRKKKQEEERLKRQAKEEEAKRKKEKALKATAEEARRKRVEKLQKVAATREAAEKEKERLAAKAEKEKEEKMRQIAIEKEKQKEEQLKKKHLMQQKTLEHEERRRQEEAARLAKLKEQEEEHKRLLAMKEREQELHKQQKAELRLAEAEKNKLQGGKLGKIAAVNNAKLKLEQGMTPSDKTNGAQPSNCYDITPAREDRPLLPPKTENDYGIDDAHSGDSSEDESQPRKQIPAWAQAKNRERLLMVNKYIPKKLWDMFMECDPCPDINQIFAGNPIKRRIRTSSAVWRTPPKYSRVAP